MTVIVGPTNLWWLTDPEATEACYYKAFARCFPVSCATRDGSRLICKANGVAWFVAPNCTQVGATWNNSTNTLVGNKPCICDWPTLCARMVSCGFNLSNWFVPSITQLINPGYVCRTQWDTFACARYWSSTECNANNAFYQHFCTNVCIGNSKVGAVSNVRAFRCVTY
jgi:hypothetical protein